MRILIKRNKLSLITEIAMILDRMVAKQKGEALYKKAVITMKTYLSVNIDNLQVTKRFQT